MSEAPSQKLPLVSSVALAATVRAAILHLEPSHSQGTAGRDVGPATGKILPTQVELGEVTVTKIQGQRL